MQIENTNTCIVSGSAVMSSRKRTPEKKHIEKKHFHLNLPAAVLPVGEKMRILAPARRLLRDMRIAFKSSRKKLLCCTSAVAISALGLGALGSFCTVGINYYSGGRLLCTVAATDSAAAIIGSAARKAGRLGAPEPKIETSAKLALKSSLVDGKEAVDAILAASPYLCRGYIASVNGEDIFIAETREEIETALADYVEKYKINDTASLSAGVEIRDEIVRRDELTTSEEAVAMLESGGAVTVMNTVDLTEQLTITHETTEIADDTLYEGDKVVETPGCNGVLVVVNEQVYSNGELLSSAIISSSTTAEPVTEVVRVGTKMRNALEDGLSYPLSGRLSSPFGKRWGRQHRGIDLAVSMNTPVMAAASGTVITAEYKESYGNLVQIDHGYGIVTSYAHLNTIDVSVGQKVQRGEVVAHSGNTGNSTGPHLHFEVINNGEYLNPLDHLI